MGTLDMHLREDVRRQLAKGLEGANVSDEQMDDLVDRFAGLVERREDDLREYRRGEKRLLALVIGWLVLVVLLWWTIGRSPVVRLEEDSADAVLEVPKALGWERRTIRYWERPPADWDYPGWYYRTASGTWAPLVASDSADPGSMEIR